MGQLVSELEIQFYDTAVADWPGEIDFYRALAIEVKERGGAILEVGCGTGRVTLRLAQVGVPIVGLDFSPGMLAVARRKSLGLSNIRWVEGDMRTFDLGERFDLILIPGHSFQFMLTPDDQAACLTCLRRHLTPDGKLVLHLNPDDLGWLAKVSLSQGRDFELVGVYPYHEDCVRKWNAWSYQPSTQTSSVITAWEIVGPDGIVKERHETTKKRLHSVSRFEMEHLFPRAGFKVEAVHGDFYRQEFGDESENMIWVARPCQ